MRKPRRGEPNHEPGVAPGRTPLDCTKCEGAGQTRTARLESDRGEPFDGAEVVTCPNCGGSGREPG